MARCVLCQAPQHAKRSILKLCVLAAQVLYCHVQGPSCRQLRCKPCNRLGFCVQHVPKGAQACQGQLAASAGQQGSKRFQRPCLRRRPAAERMEARQGAQGQNSCQLQISCGAEASATRVGTEPAAAAAVLLALLPLTVVFSTQAAS